MHPILKNSITVILGLVAGVMAISAGHLLSNQILPPPEGMEVSNMESFVANADKLTTGHWLLALLSHALGPLVSGFIAGKFLASQHTKILYGTGIVWTILGVINLMTLPHPMWFKIVDLLMYLPMTFLSAKLAGWR
jgi:hypothetical protein